MSRGFTLIELLVALVILGAMTGLLADALRLTLRASTALVKKTAGAHDLYLAGRFVARHLEQARRLSGEAEALRFTAGARAMRLYTARTPEGTRLVLEHDGQSTVVTPALAGARFDYLGGEGWAPQWTDGERLPRLIRLRLVPQPPSLAWPELLVEPRLATSRAAR